MGEEPGADSAHISRTAIIRGKRFESVKILVVGPGRVRVFPEYGDDAGHVLGVLVADPIRHAVGPEDGIGSVGGQCDRPSRVPLGSHEVRVVSLGQLLRLSRTLNMP